MHVAEGGVDLVVPEQPDAGKGADVFFNPDQELNRDLTVAVLRAVRDGVDALPVERADPPATYLDATAATGVRGVRAAADGWTATCCDVDPAAVEHCRENFARNDLEGTAVHRDANALMHEERFDVVDLDPFGTPIPFADAAFRSARTLVCVTATDLAPLCGAHFQSGVRSYGAVPRNTEYHGEMGLRVLVSALVRTAARYDLAAHPVFSHASDHYARTYLALESGAQAADALLERLGYVHHCQRCLHRSHEDDLIAHPPDSCPHCGEHLQTAGPIWLGRTSEPGVAEAVADRVTDELGTAETARALCGTLAAELDTPTHYDQHRLCKRWERGAMAMADFLAALRDAGFDASRTHYGGTTFKTDATVAQIHAATTD